MKNKGPTGGKRFQRATPSGNHKKPRAPGTNQPLNTAAGETLLTPELQTRIVNMIRAGNYAEVAARACGIHKSTYYDWLLRGGRGEEPYRFLADAVESAAAEAEARDVVVIGKAAETHWQAAAWRLERKNHKRWGRKDALELSGDEDKPVTIKHRVDPNKLSTKELETLRQLRNKARTEVDEG